MVANPTTVSALSGFYAVWGAPCPVVAAAITGSFRLTRAHGQYQVLGMDSHNTGTYNP